ncbi:putative farnesyltransferase alpha subunit [Monocercomonoides exilis]|uniref:putative farnesyltransferase alpha subunit n=1 Tax=Monocercomonoides exilis TaxID=2049356 RepID=UPI003559F2E1|nr:putative farnesyltransferase alpha subunit [Monocercomonoides exilis]|eukprot:MONOS_10708.1-p1 / transcript=MONOS_10708.1 / gene=MONOS_10708 / organism=Monocercomonoides_exilis_PA203 / gene_product=farnesyltransferase alpha subunit / transcript_product=farnesyltransferase alpha subunit / location=Mono_scaffold00497:19884-21280(+) / protein_length=372 / sequence_SO=supercontig / SO=protein_coding / is_pseudo=false
MSFAFNGEKPHVLFKNREEWKDVVPIKQDDGPTPVVRIQYTEEYEDAMDYFRGIIAKKEYSERAKQLTEELIMLCPANYNIWKYRRDIIEHLNESGLMEFPFIEKVCMTGTKNYQLWFHRQWTVMRTKFTENELKFTEEIISQDAKHYHAWAYRQWFLDHYGGWDGEFEYTYKLIQEDPFNNSAWNQRFQALMHITPSSSKTNKAEIPSQDSSAGCTSSATPSSPDEKAATGLLVSNRRIGLLNDISRVKEEIAFAASIIISQKSKALQNNESAWNFIRGFFTRCGAGYKYAEIPEATRFAEAVAVKNPMCRCAVGILVDACVEKNTVNSLLEAKEYCTALADGIDIIRRNYWLNRRDVEIELKLKALEIEN